MLPISLHPANPHYFLFQGKPTILITSAEHYGAVINLDFDMPAYLDVLASFGLNATRIYAGAYVEPEHYFIKDNTLGPKPGRYCLPWAQSGRPGWPLGGNLFDLDRWNEAYFARLKEFVAFAEARGIVVEVCLFNAMYPDTWERMPLYRANNVQGVGVGSSQDFQTLNDPRLVSYQAAYVRKITQEVNAFDNVILEICDEPGIHGTQPEDYTPWIERLIEVIREAESALPLKHLIAQQMCGNLDGPGDFSAHPEVQVIVGQYIQDTSGAQFGGMHLLDTESEHPKPIELNETAYYPIWYEGDREAASRVEAWEFLVGGGASFNHLNGLYSNGNSTAANTGNETILGALKVLKDFLYGFDFIRMKRDPAVIAAIAPLGAIWRAISEAGRQYALYLHHSRTDNVKYIVEPGAYQEELRLRLPAGDYRAEWIEPASGRVLREEPIHSAGGGCGVATPVYAVDLALRITESHQ